MGNNFFDHFGSAVCGVRVAAAHKASNVGLQFITEGKLDVVTQITGFFWIITLRCSLLMTFDIDHAAVDVNGNRF
jgi:hypothetical protein